MTLWRSRAAAPHAEIAGRRQAIAPAVCAAAVLAVLAGPKWVASGKPGVHAAAGHRAASALAETVEFRRVGQLGGESRTVAAAGGFVLLGLGSRVEVLDDSDPSKPATVGQFVLPGVVSAIAVSGETAYVIESEGRFHVLDVAAMPQPLELAVLDPPPGQGGSYSRLVPAGRYVYTNIHTGVGVIDVALPRAPRWVGTAGAPRAVTDLAVSGGRLYATTVGPPVLQVYDLGDPARPSALGAVSILPEFAERSGNAESVAVVGQMAYVSAYGYEWVASAGAETGLGSIRSQGAAPVSMAGSPGAASTAGMRGPHDAPSAPLPTNCFVVALDVSDPSAPAEVGRADVSYMMEIPGRLAVLGRRLFMEATAYAGPGVTYGVLGELLAFDIAEPSRPRLLGQFDFHPDTASDIEASGERLYLPEWSGGLRALDASAPVTPTLLYHYDTPFVPRALAGESGQVALGDHGTGGIWTIDASPPESASARGSVDLGDACAADCEIVQRDGIAYVQDENFGLFTVDVRDPTTPRRLARLDALGHGSGRGVALAVAGQYAYVGTTDWRATMDPELSVVEIADPLAPRVLGQIALPGEVSDIAPGDGHVHAVSGGGLSVVDVADPARPRIVGSLAVGGAYWQIAASGSRVFLVEGNGAFHVVDASQPARPREVGWLDKAREDQLRPNAAQEMVATSTTVYVMHLGWIQAIDVRDPTSPRELGWVSAADLGAPQRFVDMGLDASAPPPADGRGGSHADRLYLASDGNGVFIVDAELVDRPPTTTATPSTTPPSATAPATSATPESTSSATREAPTSTPVGGPTSASATSTPAATPSSAWRVFLPRVVSPSYLHAAAQG